MALNMSRKEKKELALSKLLLIVAAVIGVMVVVWLAWIRPLQHKPVVDSFETCKAAGYPIQLSYPEACMTPEGQRFVNTEHDLPSQSGYLTIQEWGIKVPLEEPVINAYATYNKSDDTVYVTTPELETAVKKISGCSSGLHGVTYARAKPGDRKYQENDFWTKADLESQDGVLVQGYYIFPRSMAEVACVARESDPQVKAASKYVQMIHRAFQSPVAQ